MLTSAAVSLTSTCLAAAAERTTAMWTVSARLAAERRKRRDEFRLTRSRCGRSQVRVVMRRRRQWRERARECSTPPEDSRVAGQAWHSTAWCVDGGRCPLLEQSRHAQCADECPLLGA